MMNRFFTLLLAASCLTTVGQVGPCGDSTSVQYHGYNYDLVEIGNQCWFQENLRTDKWRNGEFLPTGYSNEDWDTDGPSFCEFPNQPLGSAGLPRSGNLYNWHATTDPRGLCPQGYRVPSFVDWEIVIDDFGGFGASSSSLKASAVDDPSWNGSNESGLSVVNGGWRRANGEFLQYEAIGVFWTTTMDNSGQAIPIEIYSTNPNVITSSNDLGEGFSVRCLKEPVLGCTDSGACNYDPLANVDDGSCVSCDLVSSFCGIGTIWDAETQTCIGDGSGDINLDGCVQLNDLLDLLSAYGDCSAEESPWQCGDALKYQGYEYATVQIGEQCWFAENLRAGNYLNGDSIPAELSPDEWLNISQLGGGADKGARSVYGEIGSSCTALEGGTCNPDSASALFGLLYNWWACVDQRGLCPNNWHVPSDNDYSILTLQNGGESIAGGHLKSASSWLENGVGTNSLGFNALPGGFRKSNGDFDLQLLEGMWWTSTSNGGTGWFRGLRSDTDAIIRDSRNRIHGYSVRCIKDTE